MQISPARDTRERRKTLEAWEEQAKEGIAHIRRGEDRLILCIL
jgi:hypothetical protein